VSVKLGGNLRAMAMGKCSIKLEIWSIVQVITIFCHIPELESNILSIGQLQ